MELSDLKANLKRINDATRWGTIPSGIGQLDENYIFERGKITLLGGRPGALTSKFLLQLIANACIQEYNPLLFFCYGIPRQELINRLLFNLTKDPIFLSDILRIQNTSHGDGEYYGYSIARKHPDAFKREFELLKNVPFCLETRKEFKNLDTLCEVLRIRAKRQGIALVILDYLQCFALPSLSNGNLSMETKRNRELRKLQKLAQELDIHILITSKLGKHIDFRKRHQKRPRIKDLEIAKPFRCIDNIILAYRPEYHGIKVWDRYSDSLGRIPTKGCLELRVLKTSETIDCLLEFNCSYTQLSPKIFKMNNAN